jgi:hypothetical protein
MVVLYMEGSGNRERDMEEKKARRKRETREWNDKGLVPISPRANGVMGHCKLNGFGCYHQILLPPT